MIPSRHRSASCLVIFSMLSVVAFLTGCHKSEPASARETMPSVAVRAVAVESAARTAHEEVVGTVRAKLRAAIEPKVSARMESLLVAPGQTVKAGDLIAQLDAREIQAKLDPAITLQTEDRIYDSNNPHEVIGYIVRNLSARTLYFQDEGLGVRVYKYDPNGQEWLRLELRTRWNPKVTTIPPGQPPPFSGVSGILPENVPSTGAVRLVVVGWDNPMFPEWSKFAAFKDIEIQALGTAMSTGK